jgi:hypothetical protein
MIYLEDKQTGQMTDILTEGSLYTVTLEASGTETGRFYLHIKIPTVSWTDPDLSPEEAFIAYYHQHRIVLRGRAGEGAVAMLYDMGGRSLGTYKLQEGELHQIPVPELRNGLYLLTVLDGTRKSSVKLFKHE